MSTYKYNPNYAVPPGETLSEWMDEHGMSRQELGCQLGVTLKDTERIIGGELPITASLALLLETVTGIPVHFWIIREADYRKRVTA